MSTVARLVWTYFSATRLVSSLSLIGAVLIAVGIVGYAMYPLSPLNTTLSDEQRIFSSVLLGLPWFGLVCLVSASALMPGILEGFLSGHRISILPRGRLRLLASAVFPAAAMALCIAFAASVAFWAYASEGSIARIFFRTFLLSFVDIGLIYVAIWLVGKSSGVWRLAGLVWLAASVLIPARYLAGIPPISIAEVLGLVCWLAFAVMVLKGASVARLTGDKWYAIGEVPGRLFDHNGKTVGREVDFLLGTSRPWVVALGQVVPIVALAVFAKGNIWIVFLVLISALAGVVSSFAAARSRRLWLLSDCSRAELTSLVGRHYQRHAAVSLLVLLALFLGLSAWFGLALSIVVAGCVALILACFVSHYLGLMITSGLGWAESILCVLTMLTLIVTAFAVMFGDVTLAFRLEVLVVGMALVYRSLARRRWQTLDWKRVA